MLTQEILQIRLDKEPSRVYNLRNTFGDDSMNPIHARMITKLVEVNSDLTEENQYLTSILAHIVDRLIEESVDDIFEEDETVVGFLQWMRERDPDNLVFDSMEIQEHDEDELMPKTDRFSQYGS